MGDCRAKRVPAHAKRADRQVQRVQQNGLGSVCGVSDKANAVRSGATVPTGILELGNVNYSGSVVDDSE
eukprot:11281405-Prorocentrum_lima.AAC.1